MKTAAILILLILSGDALGQQYIEGTLRDAGTFEPVPGATLTLVSSSYNELAKTVSRFDGRFRFTHLEGARDIKIHALGYEDKVVRLPLNGPIELRSVRGVLKDVTVTATRSATLLQDVPVSTVITRMPEALSRSPQGLDNILRYIPGVTVTESQVSIRGSSGYARAVGSRVLLLMDGMPLLSGDNGDMKFDAIPMMAVDRVEVIKGAGSALYGSSAVGGVINVITRAPMERPMRDLSITGGIYDQPKFEQWRVEGLNNRFYTIEAGASGNLNDIGLLASASIRRNEGYRFADDISRWNLFGKATYQLNDLTTASLSSLIASDEHGGWLYWRSLSEPLVPSDSLTATRERIHSKRLNLNAGVRSFLGSAIVDAKISYYRTQYETDSLVNNDRLGPHSRSGVLSAEATSNINVSKNVNFTAGLNSSLFTVSSNVLSDQRAASYAAFAQLEWKPISQLTILPGFRADLFTFENLSTESQISPKLGANFKFNDAISIRGSAGYGFRAPTLTERYINSTLSGFRVLPNINLRPERSFSGELGGSYHDETWHFDAAVFGTGFHDLIEPKFVDTNIQFQNITKARLLGHEEFVEFRPYQNEDLKFRLGYTYVHAYSILPGEGLFGGEHDGPTLPFRPRHLIQGRADWKPGPLLLSADFRYLSRYETTDTTLSKFVMDSDERVDAIVLDASLGVDLGKLSGFPIKATFLVQNLLNHYYVEIVGNLAPLRSYALRLETTF